VTEAFRRRERDASLVVSANARKVEPPRATVLAVRRTRHRYGDHRQQVADLWRPDNNNAGGAPVVVLIHGGYWRAAYTKRLMNAMAEALASRGWAAWNIEYRRVGLFGGGGGWPATFSDVGAAVDYVRQVPDLDPDRVVTCGHSAGGHLALWTAGRHRTAPGTPGTPPAVRPLGAVALAGVVDLRRAAVLGLGGGAVTGFLGGTPEEHPERYSSGSPADLLPLGVPQVLIHGLSDTVVPPSMSEDYQRTAQTLGDDAVYVPIEGIGHREVIDPASAAWPAIIDHLRSLLTN